MARLTQAPPTLSAQMPSLRVLIVAVSSVSSLGQRGPCDIFHDGGTPCVAAHSVVRALYASYTGVLYQVNRSSDSSVLDIRAASPGGFADATAQDVFCAGTACVISRIYDQSPLRNHLAVAPAGGNVKHGDQPVNASRLRVSVSGHDVYAAYFEGGMGYRNDNTSGVAVGNNPETLYMVCAA
jgi:non-reducing end alpha-L-arabinofuranosidase